MTAENKDTVAVGNGNLSTDERFQELRNLLEGKVSDEILAACCEAEPKEHAINLMLGIGGRILKAQPDFDLCEPYAYTEEMLELNDMVGDYRFILPATPLTVLTVGMCVEDDAEEVAVMCQGDNGLFPIIIAKGEEYQHVFKIDTEERRLEVPQTVTTGFSLNALGNGGVDEDTLLSGIEQLLPQLFQIGAENDGAEDDWTQDTELLEATNTWLERHGYSLYRNSFFAIKLQG